MALATGTQLGAFQIMGSLGAGGMGEVYRARDTKLGRDVAIKTLPSSLASDKERLARFEREAKLLAALNHAHIATVHALDEHEGTLYVAMELVEGETIEQKLKSGALPVEDALRLALQIAEALEAAHGKGVIHRDLKPANVMVTRDGQVKVLDFGLAKAFSGAPDEASPLHSPALSVAMTQRGLVLGTAGYMSPEQASGQATDQRSDIWAFGVVLYEMLTGLPLFSGESVPHILADVLKTEPDWRRLPRNLHPRIRQLLERSLTKKPRNRLHSIADARVEIEAVLGDPRGVTPEAVVVATATKSSNALRLAAAVAVTAILAAAAGWLLRPAPAPVPAPVNRWAYAVPEGQTFRNTGRSVLALSPDGRRFVYNTADGLYVRSLDGLEARRIPGTEESLSNPFFSPDGQSVAYFAGGQLKRVALSGGAPVVVAGDLTNLFGASWASGGTILLGQPDGIYRVSADGGTPELVVTAQDGERIYGAELLPDGDSVLFSATTAPSWDEAQIAVQSLSTGERVGLLSGGSDARYVPTGHLVYALRDGLFAVAFDTATRSVSGGPVSLVQGLGRAVGVATAAANYGIADDGTLVYLNVSNIISIIWTPVWAHRDGTEEPLGLEPCNCVSPAVSPDGTRLAYDFPTPDQRDADVWVWSLAQRTNTRLTFEPGLQLGAVWSPDSTRIAYTSLGEGLFVRPADGTGTPEQLLEGNSAQPPVAWVWTADDELIFSEGTSATSDIGVLSLSGDHQRRPLLTSQFNESKPTLSPDGRWLAYQSDESGQFEIYVRPFPEVGTGKWQVSSAGGFEPKWSRDGKTLFYLGPSSLMETAVRNGAAFTYETPTAVLDREPYFYNAIPPRNYDISPDGQRFLLMKLPPAVETETPQIIVVTNWVEELKRRVPTN